MTKNGLESGDLAGALIRIGRDGQRTELAGGKLVAPMSLTIGRDGDVYVTDHGIFPGMGEVLKIDA